MCIAYDTVLIQVMRHYWNINLIMIGIFVQLCRLLSSQLQLHNDLVSDDLQENLKHSLILYENHQCMLLVTLSYKQGRLYPKKDHGFPSRCIESCNIVNPLKTNECQDNASILSIVHQLLTSTSNLKTFLQDFQVILNCSLQNFKKILKKCCGIYDQVDKLYVWL